MKRVLCASLLAMLALPCFGQEGDHTPPQPEAEAEAPDAEPEPEPEADPPPAEEPVAEEAGPAEEEPILLRWARPSTGGLSGFGDVIGVDPLPDMKFRAGLSISHQEIEVFDKIVSGVELENQARAQVYRLHVGAAFMNMIEVSLALPLIDQEQSSNFLPSDQDLGLGNPELSAKFLAPLESELITLGAYTRLHFSWGERDVFKPRKVLTEGDRAEWELGTTVGLNMGPASLVTNLGFRLLEGGIQTFRYRFGVAVDPMDMVSISAYWSGEEFEGKTRSVGFFGGAIHVFVADMVVIGAGAETLIVDDAVDDLLTNAIPGTTTESGDEVDYWRVTFDVSLVF